MATNTYVALDKVTVGTATPSITFSSIPQTYTDLVIVCSTAPSISNYGVYMYFNGSTAAYYSATEIRGNGTAAASTRWSNTAGTSNWVGGQILGMSNTLGNNSLTIQIMNYSNTTTFKSFISRSDTASIGTETSVGLWRGSTGSSTAAITSITLGAQSAANLVAGSTFSLYGIASAEVGAKATGGIISSDSQYYYHTFLSSGTFTPTQSISADVLVVAGGGGGGINGGGGGGAGGLLAFTSQSLTATGYTCTIGSGGGSQTVGNDSQFGALTLVKGGGRGGNSDAQNAGTGGSGGGGGASGGTVQNGGSATSGQGNTGGTAAVSGSPYSSAGGGGAGAAGSANAGGTVSGAGGIGSSTYSSWGLVTATGQDVSGTVYYAGGGGGSQYGSTGTRGAGGSGGGGAGATVSASASNGFNGTANTGGGAGGANNPTGGVGGTGGSGIVIVRYAK